MWKIALLVFALIPSTATAGVVDRPLAPNGIGLYPDYISWKVVAPSFREDRGQIRIITANEIAIAALRTGKKPLPDGSVLAKVAWKAEKNPAFPVAIEPTAFAQVEFMVKDAVKYKDTGGWGFARFVGNGLKPYGKDPGFVTECFACHKPVAANDYLFTKIVTVP